MTREQIIIIGAGPAGGYLGQLLKRDGFDPLILEEDAEVGRPVRCAGVIGRDVWEKLESPPDRFSILNALDGALIEYKGKTVSLVRRQVAYVVDRAVFDQGLAAGLRVKRSARVTAIKAAGREYQVQTTAGEYRCDFLVGADGPHSVVRRSLGLPAPAFLPGLQKRLSFDRAGAGQQLARAVERRQVLVKVFKPFSQFAWIVPETVSGGQVDVRVGVISQHPKADLAQVIKEIIPGGHQLIEENGGVIPVGLMAKTAVGRAALLGDAAAQVKPLSGGGIYFGLQSAQVLAACLKKGDLKDYDKKWKRLLAREIKAGLTARKIFDRLSVKQGDELFAVIDDNKETLEKQGDFENHTSAFLKLARDPRLIRLLGTAFWAFLRK